MFVEKISKEEITVALNKKGQDVNVVEFQKLYENDNLYYLQVDIGSTGPKPEYHITDFTVIGLNDYGRATESFLKTFLKELLFEKFGEDYKIAFNKNITKKYNEELIK